MVWLRLRRAIPFLRIASIVAFFVVIVLANIRQGVIASPSDAVLVLFDSAVFSSAVVIALFVWLGRAIEHRAEDRLKIEHSSAKLVEQYKQEELVQYRGTLFPIVQVLDRTLLDGSEWRVETTWRWYVPPEIVLSCFDELVSAHSASTRYNQVLFRVDSVSAEDRTVSVKLSPTTFVDSLVTNRSADYTLQCGYSVRDLLEPGPSLTKLEHSRLSNHLGVNVVILTSDNQILLVERSKQVSIGKNVLGIGVAASVKFKLAQCDFEQVSVSRIEQVISEETQDEIGLPIESFDPEWSLSRNTVSVFRDLYEVGKPQILLGVNSALTWDRHSEEFNQNYEKEPGLLARDGGRIVALDAGALRSGEALRLAESGFIIVKGKPKAMAPSHIATLALYANVEFS